jgi:hypothetical protein
VTPLADPPVQATDTCPAVPEAVAVTVPKGLMVVIEADVADPEPSNTFPVTVTAVLTDAVEFSVNVVVFVPLDDVVLVDAIVAVPAGTESP